MDLRLFSRKIASKALYKIGYQYPTEIRSKIVEKSTPVLSRASNCTSSSATSQASSSCTSRSVSPKGKRKRKGSSNDDITLPSNSSSDKTVVASDNEGLESDGSANTKESFTMVQGKKVIKKPRAARRCVVFPPNNGMETDSTSSSMLNAGASVSTLLNTTTKQMNSGAESKTTSGTKPTALPKRKIPPPFYLLKGSNFVVKISADCTCLRINYSKAVRVAEDKIKIAFPERKLKVVIHGVPLDIGTDDINADLINQGFSFFTVHRITRRDGSSTGLVLAVLPKTDEARAISHNLSKASVKRLHTREAYWVSATAASGARKSSKVIDDGFVPAPIPSSDPWIKKQLPRADSESSRETNRRGPPGPTPARQISN
ncbi:hypothetical protein EVAR_42425_1 [Eumeta japonica]|uniref:Uncharacterized protein n=1 Tax=Eumeta variegata TaxID=151549 RepID=A0A4C1X902_EUMVA|nr:hypothetical protein EVAR_42425_1 [Eumeta japonica]